MFFDAIARAATIALLFVLSPCGSAQNPASPPPASAPGVTGITLFGGGGCPSQITIQGTPRLGATVTMCLGGVPGCHVCLWLSKNPGPTRFRQLLIPIGFPLIAYHSLGVFPPTRQLCFPIQIPTDPNLIGFQMFSVIASHPGMDPSRLQFSPQSALTVVR